MRIRGLGIVFGLLLALVPLGTVVQAYQTPDWIATSNVKYIGNMPINGDGVGAKVIGNYLYLTTSLGLWIYDVSQPTTPTLVSGINMDVHWENEEVPTNGRILGLSNSVGCDHRPPDDPTATNCLDLFDVTDKANPRFIKAVGGAGQHTNACIFDCTWFYGSTGAVTDARDPANAKLVCNWQDPANHLPGKSPHHVREVTPGYILTATQPVMLLSVWPQDGGNMCHPKLLATGTNADGRFIHSNRWPGHGTDSFALIGGETNFRPQCGTVGGAVSDNGAFMTWDARGVLKNGKYQPGSKFTMIDQYRVQNGVYSDGGPPINVLGCSVHWFEEHPSFHDGGLVALAAYESGTRFMQVTADGHLKEQGWFIPVGRGSTSAPHWAPDGKTVYTIDYERGFDILQWLGPTYVPGTAAASTTFSAPAPNTTAANTLTPNTSARRPVILLPLVPVAVGAGLLAWRRRRRLTPPA